MDAETTEKSAYERLDPKRRRFVDALVGEANFNATKAAQIAGYADPKRSSFATKHQPLVRQAIDELLDEMAMPGREVLARLTEQARALYADFIDGAGNVDMDGLKQAGLMRLVKKISWDKEGNRVVEFHDVQAALVHLGKHHGLFTEKHEVEIHDDGAALALDRKLAGLAASLATTSVPSEPDAAGSGGA